MTDRKQVRSVRLKDEDEGKVRAVVATTGTVDADGDIIEPGAFSRQDVVVSGFGHTSWQGAPPVGRGTVMESGEKAVADLEFFLDTSHGRDLFTTVKRLGELGEWSFGFDVRGQRDPSPREREDGAVRVLTDLDVHEVSPVLRGAGVDTGTVAAKCSACGAGGTAVAVPSELMEDAKRTIRKADEALREDAAGTVKRHPERDVQSLAEFAVAVGYRLAGSPGLPWIKGSPKVRWFLPRGRTSAFMNPGRHKVHLSLDLRGEKLARAALHEAKHFAQDNPKAVGMEDDAETFARRWAGAVKAAHRATDGESYRVHLTDARRPPFYKGDGCYVRGDVVLSRSTAQAFHYNPRNTGEPWTGLLT